MRLPGVIALDFGSRLFILLTDTLLCVAEDRTVRLDRRMLLPQRQRQPRDCQIAYQHRDGSRTRCARSLAMPTGTRTEARIV
eukprot:COSAG03_NODE_13084_length_517_cov_1.028708_1_plen_81_part_10